MQLAGTNQSDPPAANQIEVSVFGPGFGECVVVHIGNSEWVVVDSCIETSTRLPVAFDYFRKIGVDPATSVKLIVATHWHDDHMAGLSALFTACPGSRFVCSMALNSSEWSNLVEIYRTYVGPVGSGIDELRGVMKTLRERKAHPAVAAPDDFAVARLPLLTRTQPFSVEIVSLAPSAAAIAIMQTRIQRELLPQEGARQLRVPCLEENDGSVVLSMNIDGATVLLGADLEERGRGGLGWRAILDEYPGDSPRYQGFKIPHHGSENGHHEDQWPRLMENEAWAVVTPYNRGKKKLPTADDCRRIMAQTPNAFITAPPGLKRFRHANSAVNKTVAESTQSIGVAPGSQGQVRFRKLLTAPRGQWTAERFGQALQIKDALTRMS